MWAQKLLLASTLLLEGAFATPTSYGLESTTGLTAGLEGCKGYKAKDVKQTFKGVTAKLELIGEGCGAYGPDLKELNLEVDYETDSRLHVKITDANNDRYEVPEEVIPRPEGGKSNKLKSDLEFKFKHSPFSFQVKNKKTREVIFDTAGHPFVFEEQYIHLATGLGSKDPNLYGLGEHTNSFRLPTKNFTRTLWNRDAYGVAPDTNLYSSHPVYFEHRKKGTHGVFLLNSNGMDVKIDNSVLEYNVIGGVVDLYFLAGPTPEDVAKQYSEIAGKPTLPPYWGLGSHQCRYGYRDWIAVAEVVANYSSAGIPLETMWTDIDYMYERWIMTLDPERFPLDKMRRIIDLLHEKKQKYIMMVDPAVAAQENVGYETYDKGVEMDVFLKEKDGSLHKGVVWPGVTVFPDWFHPNTQQFWNEEFKRFFDPATGIDLDGIWIDMNEPASFCPYPCNDPQAEAEAQNMPPSRLPPRDPPRPIPGFPETYEPQYRTSAADAAPAVKRTANIQKRTLSKRNEETKVDLISPPYSIRNEFGGLSEKTAHTDVVHHNGVSQYDAHNLYGSLMSTTTYGASLARRPTQRPFIITRSTFVGAGRKVGKWLGDNMSTWYHYVNSISGLLQFGSLYQIPLVGADVCGFGGNTTETLCARWTTLGAFYPFMRNHNGDTSNSQEPYLWEIVTSAAKKAFKIRYELLDYFYTALHKQEETGSPALKPLFFEFPKDEKTFGIDTEFFYGPSVLVAPVTEENSTSVDIYLPTESKWYDYVTLKEVPAGKRTLSNVAFDEIPVFVKGGSIIARRAFGDELPMTTAEVREKDFELLIFVDKWGRADGELYIDDGETLGAKGKTIKFWYRWGLLAWKVKGEAAEEVVIENVKVVGGKQKKFGLRKVSKEGEFEI